MTLHDPLLITLVTEWTYASNQGEHRDDELHRHKGESKWLQWCLQRCLTSTCKANPSDSASDVASYPYDQKGANFIEAWRQYNHHYLSPAWISNWNSKKLRFHSNLFPDQPQTGGFHPVRRHTVVFVDNCFLSSEIVGIVVIISTVDT